VARLFGSCSLLLLLLAQCSTPPQRVSLHTQELSLILVGASYITPEQLVPARAASVNIKVVPDEQIDLLVDAFDAAGFFEMASGSRDARARHWMEVRSGGSSRIASAVAPENNPGQVVQLAECMRFFTEVFNAYSDFYVTDMSGDDLERASAELNRAARQKPGIIRKQ
jgi:hypothetical protein